MTLQSERLAQPWATAGPITSYGLLWAKGGAIVSLRAALGSLEA